MHAKVSTFKHKLSKFPLGSQKKPRPEALPWLGNYNSLLGSKTDQT